MSSNVTIVIITRNRPECLKILLKSIQRMIDLPDNVVIVDNASDAKTGEIIRQYKYEFSKYSIIHHRLNTNTGGSGGFSAGVTRALDDGAEWLWLMDDDVELLPDGLTKMLRWAGKFQCFHGRRYDFDGSQFHFQPRINNWLAVPLPILCDPFKNSKYVLTNCGCFEGMFLHRDVVAKIGPPDPRFFITWDDAIYGWLASRVTQVAIVDSFVLKRIRPQRKISLVIRHLNDSNNVNRYYVMRNRGLVAWYFRQYGVYNPIGFTTGTLLVFLKEILRLIFVGRTFNGMGALVKGVVDGIKIAQDPDWCRSP